MDWIGDNRKLVAFLAAILFAALLIVSAVFGVFSSRYKSNSAEESASHLMEIDDQISTNVEKSLDGYRACTKGVADSLDSSNLSTEVDLLAYLQRQKTIWGVDDINVYNDAGFCINDRGEVQSNDSASRFASTAIAQGSAFQIFESTMEYASSTTSGFQLRGRPVVAVSVVRNLDTLVDDMDIAPFGGAGSIYLTRQNGVCISQSSSALSGHIYNVTSLLSSGVLSKMSGKEVSLPEEMQTGQQAVFTYREGNTNDYVAMAPVSALDQTWFVFYLVPEANVNQIMNRFSISVLILALVIVVLTIVLFSIFFMLYRKRSERYMADIRSRERLFDLLVAETNNVFLLLSDKDMAPIYVSSNASNIFGDAVPHLSNASGKLLLMGPAGSQTDLIHALNKTLAHWDGRTPFLSEYIPYSQNGSRHYMVLRLYSIQGNEHEYVGIAQDVTKERQRESDLRNALALADSASLAKTKFLSNMSHDIRTPMNAIVNMTRFAKESYDDKDRTLGYLDVIETSSEHLLQLINEVLDMSRVESGKLSFRSIPFDLYGTLKDLRDLTEAFCSVKGQTFSLECHDIRHHKLVGDPLRLNQILINLLNNASKFTPPGGHVSLDVSELDSLREGCATYRFVVKDDGVGIPREDLKRIFGAFVRTDIARASGVEGSGLGLSITNSFVKAMGGDISVESELGAGTEFTVELFFSIAEGEEERPAAADEDEQGDFHGRHALLVEDNEVNRMISEMILKEWGMTVDCAADGAEALRLFEDPDAHFDIIYMDIQMPIMDGYEATRAIRASSGDDATSIPIVAMTANVFDEDVEKARKAGMDAHVGKPIEPKRLHEVTRKLL